MMNLYYKICFGFKAILYRLGLHDGGTEFFQNVIRLGAAALISFIIVGTVVVLLEGRLRRLINSRKIKSFEGELRFAIEDKSKVKRLQQKSRTYARYQMLKIISSCITVVAAYMIIVAYLTALEIQYVISDINVIFVACILLLLGIAIIGIVKRIGLSAAKGKVVKGDRHEQ